MTIRGKGKEPICISCDITFDTKLELKKHKISRHSV